MKIETVRRRIFHIEVRLRRDLATLEKMFPRVDWEDGQYATEAIRNLATSVQYLRAFAVMSDFGIMAEIKGHVVNQQ